MAWRGGAGCVSVRAARAAGCRAAGCRAGQLQAGTQAAGERPAGEASAPRPSQRAWQTRCGPSPPPTAWPAAAAAAAARGSGRSQEGAGEQRGTSPTSAAQPAACCCAKPPAQPSAGIHLTERRWCIFLRHEHRGSAAVVRQGWPAAAGGGSSSCVGSGGPGAPASAFPCPHTRHKSGRRAEGPAAGRSTRLELRDEAENYAGAVGDQLFALLGRRHGLGRCHGCGCCRDSWRVWELASCGDVGQAGLLGWDDPLDSDRRERNAQGVLASWCFPPASVVTEPCWRSSNHRLGNCRTISRHARHARPARRACGWGTAPAAAAHPPSAHTSPRPHRVRPAIPGARQGGRLRCTQTLRRCRATCAPSAPCNNVDAPMQAAGDGEPRGISAG